MSMENKQYMQTVTRNKAVFFDRDGTLNVDIHYLHRPQDFIWTEDAKAAVKYCNDHDYLVIIITNQSGVARGYYSEADVRFLYDWMNKELTREGAHLDALYYCPHHPTGCVPEYTRNCDCRKPNPKMLEMACRDHNINKDRSFMVGDMPLDMECAKNAGIRGIRFMGGSLLQLVKRAILQEDTHNEA